MMLLANRGGASETPPQFVIFEPELMPFCTCLGATYKFANSIMV